MSKITDPRGALRRHRRVRGKIRGTAERPRLAVFRSNRGIFAQLVDDDAGKTLAGVLVDRPAEVVQGRQDRAGRGGRQAPRRRRQEGRRREPSSSTAAATCTTDASRRSPTARAKED